MYRGLLALVFIITTISGGCNRAQVEPGRSAIKIEHFHESDVPRLSENKIKVLFTYGGNIEAQWLAGSRSSFESQPPAGVVFFYLSQDGDPALWNYLRDKLSLPESGVKLICWLPRANVFQHNFYNELDRAIIQQFVQRCQERDAQGSSASPQRRTEQRDKVPNPGQGV